MTRTTPLKRSPMKPGRVAKARFNVRRAEKVLDKLWAEAIKLRDGKCQRCGRTENLQAAHIHSRSRKSTRHELLNGVCLCAGCHKFWAHQHPIEFALWVGEVVLEMEQMQLLMVRASKPTSPLDPFKFDLLKTGLEYAITTYKERR